MTQDRSVNLILYIFTTYQYVRLCHISIWVFLLIVPLPGIHVENLCTRLQQRMYFLRRLRLYSVNSKLLFLFLKSVIRYSMQTWYGNLCSVKIQVGHLFSSAFCRPSRTVLPIQSLYEKSVHIRFWMTKPIFSIRK